MDNDIIILDTVTRRKRGRPKGSTKAKKMQELAEAPQSSRVTRSSAKASESDQPTDQGSGDSEQPEVVQDTDATGATPSDAVPPASNVLFTKQFNTFRHAFAAGTMNTGDPQTLEEALARPDAAHWRAAIRKEYDGILRKKTWTIGSRCYVPKGSKVLDGKLVFKTKRDKNGDIIKRKVRWVVRGFEQRYGKDYEQTYAGVCRSATWKIVLAMAALKDWDIQQMDAVAAFLNSSADRDIFMELPPMWQELYSLKGKDLVCKLL